jgi:hypothetical protein
MKATLTLPHELEDSLLAKGVGQNHNIDIFSHAPLVTMALVPLVCSGLTLGGISYPLRQLKYGYFRASMSITIANCCIIVFWLDN